MFTTSSGIVTIDISNKCLSETEEIIEHHRRIDWIKELLTPVKDAEDAVQRSCRLYELMLTGYALQKGLPPPRKIRMLMAHGYVDQKIWFYVDGSSERKDVPLDDWLTNNEHHNDLLVIVLCNSTGDARMIPRACPVLYPTGITREFDFVLSCLEKQRFDGYCLLPKR